MVKGMIDRSEIELLGYMAKDLSDAEERNEGGAHRILNALLALYEVHEEVVEDEG